MRLEYSFGSVFAVRDLSRSHYSALSWSGWICVLRRRILLLTLCFEQTK